MNNQIKKLRCKHGLTQQQLADFVGVSSRTIISLEKGKYNPSIFLAYKIACVFDTSIEELCNLKETLKNEEKNL